jgi:hypothetical protein
VPTRKTLARKSKKTTASKKTTGSRTQNSALANRVKQLEAQLRELQDDREIRELLARYGFLADQGLDEAFVKLFTQDGVMNLVAPGNYEGVVRWQGHDRLMTFIRGDERRAGAPDPHELKRDGRRMHAQGNNLRTYIKGNEATAEAYSLVLTKMKDGSIDVEGGSNLWHLRRVGGKWLIKERVRRAMGSPSYHDPYLTKS